jgi:hypothetical protein
MGLVCVCPFRPFVGSFKFECLSVSAIEASFEVFLFIPSGLQISYLLNTVPINHWKMFAIMNVECRCLSSF